MTTTKAETFMAGSPLLTMEGITKTFPGVRALEHVDLRVESGELFFDESSADHLIDRRLHECR